MPSETSDTTQSWPKIPPFVRTGPKRPVEQSELLPRFVAGQWATPPEDIGGPPMYEVFKEAREDANHPEHEWAQEAGYVDWNHDEIHSDVIAEQFSNLRIQKTRRTSRWVMGG